MSKIASLKITTEGEDVNTKIYVETIIMYATVDCAIYYKNDVHDFFKSLEREDIDYKIEKVGVQRYSITFWYEKKDISIVTENKRLCEFIERSFCHAL